MEFGGLARAITTSILWGLLVLGNAPAARRLRRDGASDGEANDRVCVGHEVAALDQRKQILRSFKHLMLRIPGPAARTKGL